MTTDVWSGIRAGVLTCSDSCAYRGLPDVSGRWLVQTLEALGCAEVRYAVVPDEFDRIRETLDTWSRDCHFVATVGGTGFAPRDVTPEATRAVIEREAPNLVEYLRLRTGSADPKAYLSRAVAGVRGRCLIVNFPGNPRAVEAYWTALTPLLDHIVHLLLGHPIHARS